MLTITDNSNKSNRLTFDNRLVSSDNANMFPSVDNNSGLIAVF